MRILIVSNSYPPHTSPRSIRWSGIAERWAERGDDVHVIADWSPETPRQECLRDVHVHRVGGGVIERVRGRLAGKATCSKTGVASASNETSLRNVVRSAAKASARWLHDVLWKNLYWPDYAGVWSIAAARRTCKLLRQSEFDVMVTSSLPFSDHLVGLRAVKKNPDLPWIVDVGDPFSFLDQTPTNNHRLYGRRNRRAERRVFERGDAISVTNENTREIYAELFPTAKPRMKVIGPLLRTDVIGTESSSLSLTKNGRIRVSFIGTLHPGVRSPQHVLSAFRELWKTDAGENLELHFFGPSNHCESFFNEFDSELGERLFVHGPVDHATARQAMLDTDVLLNIGNTTTYQLPSKIVEYGSTGKPILNITSVVGDSSEICLQSHPSALSIRLAGSQDIDATSIGRIARFVQTPTTVDSQGVEEWCRPFYIDGIVERYDALIETARIRRGRLPKSVPRIADEKNVASVGFSRPTEVARKAISVTGGTGFIGRRLTESLRQQGGVALRLMSRNPADATQDSTDAVQFVKGDLLAPETLQQLLVPGGTLINLAYLNGRTKDDNIRAAANLAEAAADVGIARLIHCSTAVVAGRVAGSHVDETTECRPNSLYEETKLAIEDVLIEQARGRFELGILRPTAVFGPGGRNLLKLADDLRHGRRFVNYLKSCLFNRRRMNAVCVDNVVAALQFLATTSQPLHGEVFVISDDDQPGNTYREIEKRLLSEFGDRDYALPRIPLPQTVLAACLRIAGRSNVEPDCRYDPAKIMAAGLNKPTTLDEGLREFADWYKAA